MKLKHHVPLRQVGHPPCRAASVWEEGGGEKEDGEHGGSAVVLYDESNRGISGLNRDMD